MGERKRVMTGDEEAKLVAFDTVMIGLGVERGETILERAKRILAAPVAELRVANAARVIVSDKRAPWEAMYLAARILGDVGRPVGSARRTPFWPRAT